MSSMHLAFIRGPYLNNFELQSYYPMLTDKDINLVGFSSLHPQHQVHIPTNKLFCPTDLPNFPAKLPILNRLCFGDAMYLFGLEKQLSHFNIAHVRETYFHYSTQAIRAKKYNSKLKVLVTCSETIPHNHETIWGRKKLKKFVIDNTDHFHALTQKAKDCLIIEGVEETKISVIPYGVDLTKFKPTPLTKSRFDGTKWGKKSTINLLFIGRLEYQKGINDLLTIYPRIKNEFPNINLKIIGSGPLSNKLINYQLLATTCPYSEIPQVMNDSDILILPSKPTQFWEEYLGMVLLEAMACQLPIVTTNCGAIPEVVGDCAMIAKYNNPESLYRNLKTLIQTPQLRKQLTTQGYQRVTKYFNAQTQSQKLKKLYLNLINKS